MRPRLMMMTPSHTIVTSGRMCVDRITVCCPASDLISARISVICLRVEADRRLVEDQHLGIAEERLGEAHALPVALGELADEPVLHVGDEAPLHHLADARPPRRGGRRP